MSRTLDSSPRLESASRPASRRWSTPPTPQGRHFTLRALIAGLAVGTVICAANVYFGLQTGWVSIMSMPASLMGFGIFRLLRRHLRFPFSPVENVLLQSVAGGMAIMPLGCGFVGVIPAMNYLLAPSEKGPLSLSTWQLIVWSVGLCYFGVVFAVPLRHQVIIRERLRFPSGFSTAVLISVLHGQNAGPSGQKQIDEASKGGFASLVPRDGDSPTGTVTAFAARLDAADAGSDLEDAPSNQVKISISDDWAANMRLLLICFLVSGTYTVCTYFVPILRNLPIFGTAAAQSWLWTLNPSFAYVGQGIIMGTETTMHMLLGAVVGWGILSPLAKARGWAPGPVDDWEQGSKGWIIWVSLAIMLVDAIVSLAYVACRSVPSTPADRHLKSTLERLRRFLGFNNLRDKMHRYSPLPNNDPGHRSLLDSQESDDGSERGENESDNHAGIDEPHEQEHNDTRREFDNSGDAPPHQRITGKTVVVGLVLSVALCVGTIHIVFGNLVPFYATVVAVLMALVLSIMGVRALGETDLNPVSGISKLAQLFFAFIIPQSHPSSVLINLVAGAVSEAGALQAGDLMQDLKTGHLLGAAPKAQFWGQVIGASFGAVFSAFMYQLYTSVYEIPGEQFQVPTAYVWIFTARLVTGQGLPNMAKEWAIGAAALFCITTLVRTISVGSRWRPWVPGGIAVAVGMYNVPSFTLARAIGGAVSGYWVHVLKRSNTPLIILASGFILGEGFLSILNLMLQSFNVPHL